MNFGSKGAKNSISDTAVFHLLQWVLVPINLDKQGNTVDWICIYSNQMSIL